MKKIKTIGELRKLREKLQAESSEHNSSSSVRIKVAMATCSIASGSKDILDYIKEELVKRNIDATITQTGCMGYCYAEPTIEVTLPGSEPVTFGYVNQSRVNEIIEKYIKTGEPVQGIIPVNYQSIEER